MATIKSYTDLEQSKKLAEILPLESADMCYMYLGTEDKEYEDIPICAPAMEGDLCAWSLAALLNLLHSKEKDIPSLSGGGYKDGEYISDWCLDYEFEDGDYQKTFAGNPVDACVAMIEELHELKLL